MAAMHTPWRREAGGIPLAATCHFGFGDHLAATTGFMRSSSTVIVLSPSLNQGDVKVFTRAANDWSHRFNSLCAALAKLKVANAVIDGEAVHVEENGSFSFHGLQNALSTGKLDQLQYYAFDLLHLDGIDLRDRPLTDRKARLEKILINPPPLLAYSEHFVQPGNQVFERACDLALKALSPSGPTPRTSQAETMPGSSRNASRSRNWSSAAIPSSRSIRAR